MNQLPKKKRFLYLTKPKQNLTLFRRTIASKTSAPIPCTINTLCLGSALTQGSRCAPGPIKGRQIVTASPLMMFVSGSHWNSIQTGEFFAFFGSFCLSPSVCASEVCCCYSCPLSRHFCLLKCVLFQCFCLLALSFKWMKLFNCAVLQYFLSLFIHNL